MIQKNTFKKYLLGVLLLCLFFVNISSHASTTRRFLIDFGGSGTCTGTCVSTSTSPVSNSNSPLTGTYWTNITSATDVATLYPLQDASGTMSSLRFRLNTAFAGVTSNGTTSNFLYPTTAIQDGFYFLIGGIVSATATLSGMNDNAQYTINFLGSRYDTAAFTRIADYTINGVTQKLETRNNDRNLATFSNITSSGGNITVAITQDASSTNSPAVPLNIIDMTETVYSAPTVSAGTNQSIQTPASTTTLTGSASTTDGTVSSYKWSQVSGPATASFGSVNSSTTSITGLTATGTYVFKLTATSSLGLSASSTVNVVVSVGLTPVSNSGSNQFIALPTTSTTLTGSGSEVGGSISGYLWTQLSGPTTSTIVSPSSSTTNVTGMTVAGTYVFQLTVTDPTSNTATSSMNVVVGQAPAVSAGPNRTITLPTKSVGLAGTVTSSSTISSFSWSQLSGPATATITPAPTSDTLSDAIYTAIVYGLNTSGTYVFQLSATDTNGLSANSTVSVTVNSEPVNYYGCPAKKVAVIGSSTSYGSGPSFVNPPNPYRNGTSSSPTPEPDSPTGLSWVNKFTNFLYTNCPGSSLYNFGVQGSNTWNGLPTGSTIPVNRQNGYTNVDTLHNITAALSVSPDIIIVNFPTNDQAFNWPDSDTENNLNTIAAAATAANVPVWITTTQPRSTFTLAERNSLIAIKDWVISTYGTKALDFWSDSANSDGTINDLYNGSSTAAGGGGIHQDDLGHQAFFNKVTASTIVSTLLVDTNPPIVSITSPASSSTIYGTVTVTASSSDDRGVSGVQFQVDGTNYGSAATSSPYTISFNTSAKTDGLHTLSAISTDINGNLATSTSINVIIDNTPPTISAGSPSGTIFSTSTTLSVTTNESSVCKYSNSSGTAFGSMTSFTTTGGATHNVSLSGLANGTSYSYYVKCQDNYSNTSNDYLVSFSVSAIAPTSPTSLTATPGNSQISLSWTAPSSNGGSALTDYLIEYKLTSTSTWNTFSHSASTSTSAVITSLTNGVSYDFRVSAINSVGTSTASGVASSTSIANLPAVTSQSASNISFTSATLNGTLTNTGGTNPTIEGFYYGTTTSYGLSASSTGSFSTGSFQQSISGLTCGTTYHFASFATNIAGTSTSTDQTFTTSACLTAPTSPTSLTATPGNSQISLSWTAPSSNGGSALTDYLIEYKLTSTSTWNTFSHSASTSTSAVITSLTNGVSYDFRVSAINSVGTSTASGVASSSPDILATYISAISVSSIGDTYTTINWTTDKLSSSLVNYGTSIPYSSTTTEFDLSSKVLNHSVNISNLNSCTTYQFNVQSLDSDGLTSTSSNSSFTTTGCYVNVVSSGGGGGGGGGFYYNPIVYNYNTSASSSNSGNSNTTSNISNIKYLPFNKDLKLGDKSSDVKRMQQFLNNHGFLISKTGVGSPGKENGSFGSLTKNAVIKFQEYYKKEILIPAGVKKGTGMFFGKTREWANKMIKSGL